MAGGASLVKPEAHTLQRASASWVSKDRGAPGGQLGKISGGKVHGWQPSRRFTLVKHKVTMAWWT